ncbi:MAG: SDR family oxidoreductase [Chloroflexi bacterium]|nr:SDR family oxidoreductase [Chloroflexota bacterium]
MQTESNLMNQHVLLPAAASPAQLPRGVLQGSVAVVTGASRGIGRAIASELAAAGAAVALVGRSDGDLHLAASQIEQNGGQAIPVIADITSRRAVSEMVRRVEAELGAPDLLVNNAGRLSAIGPLWEIDPDDWWSEVEVNLRGPALCAHAVLPGMVARRRGTIVNVSSISANMRSGFDSAYTASKAALLRLSASLASETATHGIRVFAVHPGTVKTELTHRLMETPEGRRHFGFFHELSGSEWSEPEAVARLCVQLAAGDGDRLSGYFVNAVDSPTNWFWRQLGTLGVSWRELYAMYLRRRGRDQSRRPAQSQLPTEVRAAL